MRRWDSVSQAQCVKQISAYRTKDISCKIRLWSSHLAKRVTRLSGVWLSGTCVAMWGSCVLLPPTMPLMNAAIESYVWRYPEHWFWLRQRWKQR